MKLPSKKNLSLSTQKIRELNGAELSHVAGGSLSLSQSGTSVISSGTSVINPSGGITSINPSGGSRHNPSGG